MDNWEFDAVDSDLKFSSLSSESTEHDLEGDDLVSDLLLLWGWSTFNLGSQSDNSVLDDWDLSVDLSDLVDSDSQGDISALWQFWSSDWFADIPDASDAHLELIGLLCVLLADLFDVLFALSLVLLGLLAVLSELLDLVGFLSALVELYGNLVSDEFWEFW